MKRHALFIGIDRYEDEQLHSLSCAESDAFELHGFIKHRAGFDVTECLLAPSSERVLEAVERHIARLSPGDLFLLFFAGHGVTHEGRHLLLCAKARHARLRYLQQVLPVDLLKEETARAGVHRVFLLDACRSDLLKTRHPGTNGFTGVNVLRDVAARPAENARAGDGSLTVVCSCDEGGQASEIQTLNGGVFRLALQETLAAAEREERAVAVGDEFISEVERRMTGLAELHGIAAQQRTWMAKTGPPTVLLAGRAADAQAGIKTAQGIASDAKLNAHQQATCDTETELDTDAQRLAQSLAGLQAEAKAAETERERLRLVEEVQVEELKLLAGATTTADDRTLVQLVGQLEAKRHTLEDTRARQGNTIDLLARALADLQTLKAARVNASKLNAAEAELKEGIQPRSATATKDEPWSNSLGMKFVPVPGTEVLFSIWETRVQDYAAYAANNTRVDASWKDPSFDGVPLTPGPTHPVVNVNWNDAQAFANWLTEKERREDKLTAAQCYRLPQDWEWSVAVGLNEARVGTPEDKNGKIKDVYPWGRQWPPPKGAENFNDISAGAVFRSWTSMGSYTDGIATTSPVGSFAVNQFGLFDLSGNVWEWCEDWNNREQKDRVLRGGSWLHGVLSFRLLSSSRFPNSPDFRSGCVGFRLVLAGSGGAR